MPNRIVEKVTAFLAAEEGPTTVEYAVLLALIVGMMAAAIAYVGEQGNATAGDVVNGLSGALNDN